VDIQSIEGVIEVLGAKEFTSKSNRYSYIRILDKSGNVHTVNHVHVYNSVDSYLTPGLSCKLFLAKYAQTEQLAFAISANSRNIYDKEEVRQEIESKKWQIRFYTFMAIISVPLIIFVAGLLMLPASLLMIYLLKKTKLKVSQSQLDSYLIDNGFSIN
jgi:uncharacterized protein YqhQ